MAQFSRRRLREQVLSTLAVLLHLPEKDVTAAKSERGADLVVAAAGHTFVIEVLGSATAGTIAAHSKDLVGTARRVGKRATPLLAVPYMSEAGRRACDAAQISWFDLSGNSSIVAPGIRVIVEGRPNQFRRPGRPASIFAPKSARVVRWLLINHKRAFTQREIARATEMTEGFVSRIASRLENDSYIVRDPNGALRVQDPALLLSAWRDEYQFDKHTRIQGHVAARSGDALARFASDILLASGVTHAATGLSAAWQLTHFASFRIATFFVAEEPSKNLKSALGFREEGQGANLWLVVPNDAGVFQGAEPRDGVSCVHPVQVYVDLKGHPERATEAADRLRAEALSWRHDG